MAELDAKEIVNDISKDLDAERREQKLWSWLEAAALESARVREDHAQLSKYKDWLSTFYGEHWPATMPSFRPPIVANELRTLVLAEASDLSEAQPRIYITRDPRKGGRDRDAERALHAIWRRNGVDMAFTYASLWALIAGTGFVETFWDCDAIMGLGEIMVQVRDPRTVLPDPDAKDDKDWTFRILETVMPLFEIKRLFPVSAHKVKPEDRFSMREGPTTMGDTGTLSYRFSSPLYPIGSGPTEDPALGYKTANARVLDCILIDPSTETVVEEQVDVFGKPMTGEKGEASFKQKVVKKYPYGRRIVGCNGVILYDGPSPNPNSYSGKLDTGLVRVVLEPTLDRFWGSGFVQQTAELQMAADKMLSALVENAIRLNNGMLVTTGNTGLDMESFASIPGQIVQLNQGSSLKVEYPPPMPNDMVEAPWRMLDLQRRILGFQDARAGMPSRGNVSAELTETEISQGQSTTRLRARMLYAAIQRLAEMVFARMCYFYTTPRTIPAVEGEEFRPVTWTPVEHPEQYAIYVDPASVNIMSRTLIKRLGVALYKLQAIDRKALLENVGWPAWSEVAKRMDDMDKAKILSEAMQDERKKNK
jgi:hypothetical protein